MEKVSQSPISPESQTPTTEQLRRVVVEKPKIDKDDCLILSGELSDLRFVAGRVMRLLDRSIYPTKLPEYFDLLLEGQEIRPAGWSAVGLRCSYSEDLRQEKYTLYVENRNARGDASAQELLAKAVENALNPDEYKIES
jgi:hypothetical protein